ncbi:hypothetical protein FACS1894105_11600 [Clostridia bacterium]|nr:hypothetical protein FACS1894105_11600 [Clostridia bacterium]
MDKYNSEHYRDPTAQLALKPPRRPLVYVCSAFAGDTEHNIERTLGYCRFTIREGGIPIAPHLMYPRFMDDNDKKQRELGLFFALVLLGKADELWVFGGEISSGMTREIAKAKRRDMPIRYFSDKCEIQHQQL